MELLDEAVRRESAVAVCHSFGVTARTVSKWRMALGIGPVTAETHELRNA